MYVQLMMLRRLKYNCATDAQACCLGGDRDTELFKRYKLPVTGQIPAEMVQAAGRTVDSKIHSLILFGIKNH